MAVNGALVVLEVIALVYDFYSFGIRLFKWRKAAHA